MFIDLSASGEEPQMLLGYDAAAEATTNLLPMCVQSLNGPNASTKSMEIDKKMYTKPASSAVYFYFNIRDHEPSRCLPHPAPPPKLHYSTFWRGVTRRIFRKRLTECMQLARMEIKELEANKSWCACAWCACAWNLSVLIRHSFQLGMHSFTAKSFQDVTLIFSETCPTWRLLPFADCPYLDSGFSFSL